MIPYIYRKFYTEEDRKQYVERNIIHAKFTPNLSQNGTLTFQFKTDEVLFQIADYEVYQGLKSPFVFTIDFNFKDGESCKFIVNNNIVGQIDFEIGGKFSFGVSSDGESLITVNFIVKK